MIDPFTLSLIASSIPAVAQGITGLVQGRKAKNMLAGLDRPTFNIPTAATESLNQARMNASTMQMAGQTQAEQGLNQTAANALYNINQNATSAPEALAAMVGVYGNQMGAQNQLSMQAARDYNARQRELVGALDKYSGWQAKEWDYNVNQPFQEKAMAARALAGAGMNNKFQALKGLSGIGATALQNPDFKKLFDPKTTAVSGNSGTGVMSDAGSQTYSPDGNTLTNEQKSEVTNLLNALGSYSGIGQSLNKGESLGSQKYNLETSFGSNTPIQELNDLTSIFAALGLSGMGQEVFGGQVGTQLGKMYFEE